MNHSSVENRREFLKASLAGGFAAMVANRFMAPAALGQAGAPAAAAAPTTSPMSKVVVTNGDQRADNVFRALRAMEKEIAGSIANRRVVIKVNNVSTTNQLAATHSDALVGILDFLKSAGKLENTIIAESSAGQTAQGFDNFGYTKLADKYNVKLVDLDQEKFQTVLAFNETDAIPHPVRVSSILANQQDNYIISACMLKTHNFAVATMSIKNVILGSALKFSNGGGAATGRRGGRMVNDKPILHGGGAHGININLAMLAPLLHPSLSVIDGYEGMEGNGPVGGTKVDHRVCVVGADYVAADSVGAALMGIAPNDIGYLKYCGDAKLGENDLSRIEIVGEPIEKLARKYQLGSTVQNQMQWKVPARVTPT